MIPGRGHLPDPVAAPFGDIEPPLRRDHDVAGDRERSLAGSSPIAAEASLAGARHRVDHPARGHAADAVVSGVGDVKASIRAERHTPRVVQECLAGRATIAAEAPLPVLSDDGSVLVVGDLVRRSILRGKLAQA